MKTYKIHMRNGEWKDSEGREVRFAEFEEFKFILHKRVEPIGGLWRVTELETGFYIADGKTPNETLRTAKHKLFEVGRRFIRGSKIDAERQGNAYV